MSDDTVDIDTAMKTDKTQVMVSVTGSIDEMQSILATVQRARHRTQLDQPQVVVNLEFRPGDGTRSATWVAWSGESDASVGYRGDTAPEALGKFFWYERKSFSVKVHSNVDKWNK